MAPHRPVSASLQELHALRLRYTVPYGPHRLTHFSQHLNAGMQVLVIVKEVRDLELRVRYSIAALWALSYSLLACPMA